MTLGVAILACLAGGLASIGLAARLPRAATSLAIAAAAAALVLGVATGATTEIAIGGTTIAGSATTRFLTVGWSTGVVLLTLIGAATLPVGLAPIVGGAGLLALAGGILAVSVDAADVAFVGLAVGGVAAVVVPTLGGWLNGHDGNVPIEVTARAMAATAGAAIGAVVLVAWSHSSAGPLLGVATGGAPAGVAAGDGAVRAAVGLAVAAMAALVVVRSGAIPGHLWAAGLVGAGQPLAVPAVLGWGTAAFTLVAAAWARDAVSAGAFAVDDVIRWIVVLVALASLVLGGLAALLHDDIEHVMGYSLVQDAAVALLAFAALRAEIVVALATWLIASAALKTGLAAWLAVIRWAYGTHRLSELPGWARRAPLLGIAFAMLVLGSVGLPGMALFGARVTLVSEAVPGGLAGVVIALALSPLLVLGRVLIIGLASPGSDVAAASDARTGRSGASLGGWSRGGPRWWLGAIAAVLRENKGLGVGVATLLLAVLGLALAIAGAGDAVAAAGP